jgi:hypothetical protein
MNGKPNSGSINTTSKVPAVGSPGQSSPKTSSPDKRQSVPQGTSAGSWNDKGAVPPVSGGKEGSPNDGANPQHPAAGEMRTPITR